MSNTSKVTTIKISQNFRLEVNGKVVKGIGTILGENYESTYTMKKGDNIEDVKKSMSVAFFKAKAQRKHDAKASHKTAQKKVAKATSKKVVATAQPKVEKKVAKKVVKQPTAEKAPLTSEQRLDRLERVVNGLCRAVDGLVKTLTK